MDKLTIKTWAEEDRPREKLSLKGKAALTDAELLAIIIGSGSLDESAVELSKKILATCNNNLNELGKKNMHELMTFKGIGEAKAISIIAALEIGKRRKETSVTVKEFIKSSSDAANIFIPLIGDLQHEEFWILLLNRANQVMSKQCMSSGGMSGTVVDTRLIFKAALDARAVSIVLCHNHPSGNLKPSAEDERLTKNLREAGKLMDITVLDHVIVSQQGYYSFADEGML